MQKVVINGMVTDDLRVPLDDRGFTVGDGLFETIPLYGGSAFLLGAHMERMGRGADLIGLTMPVDEKKVAYAISDLARANNVSRGVARLTVTRGPGPRGYSSVGTAKAWWYLSARQYEMPEKKREEGGYKVLLSPYRVDPDNPLRGIKSVSALDRVMATDYAVKLGADEALSLTRTEHIASLQASNIFWVTGGILRTPSLDCGILAGVTRKKVIALAKKEGLETVEGKYLMSDLAGAQEAFATNSLIEIMPISSVEGGIDFGKAGPITLRLLKAYKQLI
ncbi:MAG: aminotransferase class IV [Nitrospinota bacterium]|nr:aminotransferase class IV [Nitrospinota bacterium]MDH5678252.1 aminotransferase class IV [Nitrospinota bacterium]